MPLAQVEKITDSGRGLKHLILQVPTEVTAEYRTPGQYVVLSQGEEKSFFAIASAPNDAGLHLLVKDQPGLAARICALQPGEEIECSPAQGKGFQLDEGRDTHLFSMGSGISPFRALIEHHINGGFKSSGLTLWQGCLDREHLPFSEDIARWESQGINIKLCFDREGDVVENVRQRLVREAPDLVGALAFWIGSKDFGSEVKDAAVNLGLKTDDYRSNY